MKLWCGDITNSIVEGTAPLEGVWIYFVLGWDTVTWSTKERVLKNGVSQILAVFYFAYLLGNVINNDVTHYYI